MFRYIKCTEDVIIVVNTNVLSGSNLLMAQNDVTHDGIGLYDMNKPRSRLSVLPQLRYPIHHKYHIV